MGPVILLGLAAAVVYAGSLYVFPFRPCGKCKGSGRKAGSNRRRFGHCGRCGGSGRRRRLGAKSVHRAVLGLRRKRTRKDLE